MPDMVSACRSLWSLDSEVDFLNHGSFGACPIAVIEHQRDWQGRLEREPVRFMVFELERELDRARAAVAAFVGSSEQDLAFIPNTTTGVNAILASLELGPGDELLLTDHGYGACLNAAQYWAGRSGAKVCLARVPFPISSTTQVVDAVVTAVTARTRLVLIDHVTSPTGLVFPVAELVRELRNRGVATLVDGAHAPGMLPLRICEIAPDYYVGNLHKWCCAPKGAAFLWVTRQQQRRLRPLVISHGSATTRTARSRFLQEFDWVGTDDPSAVLSAPFAIRYLDGMVEGGWAEIFRRNRALVLEARQIVSRKLGLEDACPDGMVGTMAALILPDDPDAHLREASPYVEPLYGKLTDAGFQAMVIPWPKLPARLLRLSAHLYNDIAQYERLAAALASV